MNWNYCYIIFIELHSTVHNCKLFLCVFPPCLILIRSHISVTFHVNLCRIITNIVIFIILYYELVNYKMQTHDNIFMSPKINRFCFPTNNHQPRNKNTRSFHFLRHSTRTSRSTTIRHTIYYYMTYFNYYYCYYSTPTINCLQHHII